MDKKVFMKLQNGSDIRGVAEGEGATLTRDVAAKLGALFGEHILKRTGKRPNCQYAPAKVAVGFDSRRTGQILAKGFCDGLLSVGVEPHATGISTTPAMFMSTVDSKLAADGGVMVTASHLPPDRNGFKFFTTSGGYTKADVTAMLEAAFEREVPCEGELPLYYDLMGAYKQYLEERVIEWTGSPTPLLGKKIIVDAGGGAAGFYAEVLKKLGADVEGSLYLEPDGNFTGHIPNPEDDAAMREICETVTDMGAHFGIAFDTDGDRAAIVGADGKLINKNRMIALTVAVMSSENMGGTVVTDSVTSNGLAEFIKEKGMVHLRYKRGYKNIIDKGIELCENGIDAPLAIETSGHCAMRENFFLDDGTYLVTRMLPMLINSSPEQLIEGLKEPCESVSERYGEEALGEDILERIKEFAIKTEGLSVTPDNYEGVRIDCDSTCGNGWILLRRSLHDPLYVANIESDDLGGIERIKAALSPVVKL